MSALVHKCSDAECTYFGKPSPSGSCLCHVKPADMLAASHAELLEALEAAEDRFGPFAEITINGQYDPDDVRVVALMRAAIAKARGQA